MGNGMWGKEQYEKGRENLGMVILLSSTIPSMPPKYYLGGLQTFIPLLSLLPLAC
jgi:hypothetical protein